MKEPLFNGCDLGHCIECCKVKDCPQCSKPGRAIPEPEPITGHYVLAHYIDGKIYYEYRDLTEENKHHGCNSNDPFGHLMPHFETPEEKAKRQAEWKQYKIEAKARWAELRKSAAMKRKG